MEYMLLIENYFNQMGYQDPIFANDIFDYIKKYDDNFNQVLIITYINRYIDKNLEIERFSKGIYYKAKSTLFGKTPINYAKLYKALFLEENGNVIGYESGPSFINKLGLTTQLPNKLYFTTENNRNTILNNYVKLIKPIVPIDETNYKYLQILDVLHNKYNVEFEVENPNDIIYEYIKYNNLSFEKLLYYAKMYKNNNLIYKLADIAKGA